MSLNQIFIDKAKTILGETGFFFEESDIEPYSHDEFATAEYSRVPLAVIKPSTEKEVSQIVKLCQKSGIPLTPRGAGTGLSAGCVPSKGGVVLSLERLNKVINVDKENQSITLQAGVTLEALFTAVEEAGLFFPPHPGDEGAMVGGLAAANAGGARAVKYGTIKQFIRALTVVFPDGRTVKLGGNTLKSSSGYHLMDLMIGSEGTLGIITEATLSLLPKRGASVTLVIPFEKINNAIECVQVIFQHGIVPFAVEFVEHSVISFVEKLLNKSWPAKQGSASLLIILEGPGEEELLVSAERIAEITEQMEPLDVLIADKKENQADILEIRSMIYEALRPGTAELFDVCVPRAQIAGHVEFVHSLEEKIGMNLPTYGHAGDGNIHTHAMKNPIVQGVLGEEMPDWKEKLDLVRREIYRDAAARGGVISGEHGIGLVKRDYLEDNIGSDAVDIMRKIKKALDPAGIMNPGKIFK